MRRWQLKRLATSGKPTKFLTLTMKEGIEHDAATAALMLSDAFRKLLKRWRRHKHGQDIEFLAVFEPTKNGRPHLHVMLRAPYTRQQWLSKQMLDLLDSPIVDIRAITDRRKVAKYIAKYITKSNIRFGKAKRYWCSKRYSLDPSKKRDPNDRWGSGWSIFEQPLWLVAEEWSRLHRVVIEWDGEHCFTVTAQAP